ncbi:DNA polymerase Y family protein [Microbacterium karelineae]|uniref:DNA polymerase Y family protein n=1 Tax=Microbacterium karelineae TaxID=2654283 RepID=UPI001E5342CD|nr:DNA polymerase Y family protein [Microbacterium karelineae]
MIVSSPNASSPFPAPPTRAVHGGAAFERAMHGDATSDRATAHGGAMSERAAHGEVEGGHPAHGRAAPEQAARGTAAPDPTAGGAAPERAIVLWLPDWPITAHLRTQAREAPENERVSPDDPLAIVHDGRIVTCSAAARAEGVRRGQRRRDAQGACSRLRLLPADEGRDERAFHRVLTRLEELTPGVQPLRPGVAALRARGPARFYRGERAAAEALLRALADDGLAEARAGVADGLFTAEQAARAAPPDDAIRVVSSGGSSAFLAPLPTSALGDGELALFLARLGVQTLGEFAALPAGRIHDRLGPRGARLHDLAAGADSRTVVPRVPPPELARELDLEPPLELAEQVAFAVRRTADAFCDGLGAAGLVCTAVRITIESDLGGRSERVWQHPQSFDAASVVDRVRWQLQPSRDAPALTGGICRIAIEPDAVDDAAGHQPALVGQGPDERTHHAMTRVQSALGHRGVLTPAIGGGRWLAEREALRPWGDAAAPARRRDLPWPGSLPPPLPTEVFHEPRPVRVTGAGGAPVAVDERGLLTAPPAAVDGRRIARWAGPWPVVERTWDPARARSAHRFQLVDDEGSAWLAVLEHGAWWLEGRYA